MMAHFTSKTRASGNSKPWKLLHSVAAFPTCLPSMVAQISSGSVLLRSPSPPCHATMQLQQTRRRTRYKLPLVALAICVSLLYFWSRTAVIKSPAVAESPVIQTHKEDSGLANEQGTALLAGFQTETNKEKTDSATVEKLVQSGEIPDHKNVVIGDDSVKGDAEKKQKDDGESGSSSASAPKGGSTKAETLILDTQEKADPHSADSKQKGENPGQSVDTSSPATALPEKQKSRTKLSSGDAKVPDQSADQALNAKITDLTPEQQKEKDEKERKQLQKQKEDQQRERRWKLEAQRKEQKDKVLFRLSQPHESDYRKELTVSDDDIGVIVRTGYDVQHRLEGPLCTFLRGRENHTFLASDVESTWDGHKLHDSIGRLGLRPSILSSDKYKLYEKLKARAGAVKVADEKYDYNNKETEGWSLDGLKFVSSIEIGYDSLGANYKWYLILDDDTYVHYPSLKTILSSHDYRDNLFLGMGGWVMGGLPYAHGGAGIVVSQAAMAARFTEHAESLGGIHDRAVTTRFGDYLFSIAMDEIGITVDNTYRPSFHEHEPARERISKDDICKPAITYHHLAISVMKQIEAKFGDAPFSHLDMRKFLQQDSDLHRREGWSYNLERDDNKDDPKVRADLTRINMDDRHKDWMNADRCAHMCIEMTGNCIAWTYIEEGEKSCVLSDFFRMGYARSGMVSGVNKEVMDSWLDGCHGYA